MVVDDGPGIPLADRRAVFTAFHRGESSRSRATGGTGLGLGLCSGSSSASTAAQSRSRMRPPAARGSQSGCLEKPARRALEKWNIKFRFHEVVNRKSELILDP